MKHKSLRLDGVSENNLKEVSLEIPHDALVSVTGLSGSGKSSLAFNTVYAEGQRRYIETFSPYTRQFLDKIKKPEATYIANVRPAIAIQQKTRILNSRSTVGSLTNLNDYLRTIWAHIALPTCPECHTVLKSFSALEVVQDLKQQCEKNNTETYLICSQIQWPKTKKKQLVYFEHLANIGYSRYLDPGTMRATLVEPGTTPPRWLENSSLLVFDRCKAERFDAKSLQDSIAQAYAIGAGCCYVIPASHYEEKSSAFPLDSFAYYQQLRCPDHEVLIPKVRKSLFSFNHPNGACEHCNGFGYVLRISEELVVPNPGLSLQEKALHCWSSDTRASEFKRMLRYCKANDIPTTVPWHRLKTAQKDALFTTKETGYIGVLPWFKRLERKSYKMHVRVFLSKYRAQKRCPHCDGKRLKPEALLYRYQGVCLPDLWQMQIDTVHAWLQNTYTTQQSSASMPKAISDLFKDTMARLEFLLDLGLPYVSMDRQARTLSGGETQRVNLAAALGSNLTATHFVLDEPSVGLHPRDTQRLIESVIKLRNKNNSILVVEHDPDFIQAADQVIEIGPGAGSRGGTITYNGSYAGWKNKDTLLLKATPKPRRSKSKSKIHIKNAHARNLQNVTCSIPLESLTMLSGVSGSGKSTLVSQVLLKAYQCVANNTPMTAVPAHVTGLEKLHDCLYIDQSPLAKSPRANVATYTKIWDELRTLLAATEAAATRALSKSSFSFNVDQGRCTSCKGAGFIKEDMQFLSDVYLPCEDCLGKRFQEPVLEVTILGKNVFDLLNTSISETKELFGENKKILASCTLLESVGLGHLRLGHPLSDLSGGEAQRLRLIHFIDTSRSEKALLIFDEPSTGLHVQDTALLLALLQSLRDQGHTILVIEHNLDLLAAADWIIDLGPEGGSAGGELLFEGTVAQLLASKKSFTAAHLKQHLGKRTAPKKKRKVNKRTIQNQTTIKGARQHNLQNIDLDVPLETIVAFTGVSGSGKSSIAKDILFAEGQRRYLDCLSPYARQFIKGLDKPVVDSIENIPPSMYVGQHVHLPLQTSTIATLSEIYNFLRLLFVKLGQQFCPEHPTERIANLSAEQIVHELQQSFTGRIKILAPIIVKKKGTHKEIFARALAAEVNEVRVDGIFCKPGAMSDGLERNKVHSIEYVIAACRPKQMDTDILIEAVAHALALGGGVLNIVSEKDEYTYSAARACPVCKRGFFKPDPEDLSFSSKRGACPRCAGSGTNRKGAPCKHCNGQRINAIGRNIRLNGLNISELVAQTPAEVENFLELDFAIAEQRALKNSILVEVRSKLRALQQLGLNHLALDRDCRTLSSGELQRVRLTSVLGSSLTGVLYLLDEPSAGLHPLDTRLVLNQLDSLKEQGNSVVLIEHDPDSILSAEHIIEIGPGGGKDGGHVVFNGSKAAFLNTKTKTALALKEANSLTQLPASTPSQKRTKKKQQLHIKKAQYNTVNIKNLSVPLQELVVVAGVSGAGKSSFVHGIIAETLLDGLYASKRLTWESEHALISSDIEIEKMLLIDQQPIGKNSRSTPASYLGLWNHIRTLYAATAEAKTLGWKASFFSYNTGKGRCPTCEGRGERKLEMNFLANASISCDTCEGRRFSEEANSVKYLGLSISDVLALTITEAKSHFVNHPKVRKPLERACALGIGYLTLGQSSATLSGGEAQRLRLVAELSTKQSKHTLYVLDEPTTGLHLEDVQKLLTVLRELVALGNSVIVIEHDAMVLRAADHIIELGPGPGDLGGTVIFSGTPEKLSKSDTPWGALLSNEST